MFSESFITTLKQFGVTAVIALVSVYFIIQQQKSLQADNSKAREEIISTMQTQINELNTRVDMCQGKYDSLLINLHKQDVTTVKILMQLTNSKTFGK